MFFVDSSRSATREQCKINSKSHTSQIISRARNGSPFYAEATRLFVKTCWRVPAVPRAVHLDRTEQFPLKSITGMLGPSVGKTESEIAA